MQCPPEIAAILTQILTTGLLRIRALGWDKQGTRCAVEADHLHNLPALLVDFKPKNLEYYWRTDRQCYIRDSSPEDVRAFEQAWTSLAKFVDVPTKPALAG